MNVVINGVRYIPDVSRGAMPTSFARFLTEHRKRIGVAQQAASVQMGFAKSRVYHLESGAEPSLRELVKLADFYGFSVEQAASYWR